MLRYVEKGGCCAEEVAVEILAAPHHHPRIVKEGVVFLAAHPCFVLRIGAFARFLFRLLLDGTQLYGFLGFLYRPVEVALWLRGFFVGLRCGRVYEQHAREVVLVAFLHLVKCLLIVCVAVVVDVVSRDELLIFARGGGVLFG